ncbi:hypothetical protein PAPYR_9593 [Paratrimastix pyriformis]|uniref:DisA/LigA helix-hairpin-helix motif domain-containing protein n=1 Tax=Paratrimastix pyriformis TaxID=342808 RepID=A0ABQ8UC30_9EUKA|nr:hypothetical protein PAPYR_9593 [Paratrimastix pyriformis]
MSALFAGLRPVLTKRAHEELGGAFDFQIGPIGVFYVDEECLLAPHQTLQNIIPRILEAMTSCRRRVVFFHANGHPLLLERLQTDLVLEGCSTFPVASVTELGSLIGQLFLQTKRVHQALGLRAAPGQPFQMHPPTTLETPRKEKLVAAAKAIPTLSDVRARALLDAFGSLECLSLATRSQLQDTQGIGAKTAETVATFLQG